MTNINKLYSANVDAWGAYYDAELGIVLNMFWKKYPFTLSPCGVKEGKKKDFIAALKEFFSDDGSEVNDFITTHGRLICDNPIIGASAFYRDDKESILFGSSKCLSHLSTITEHFSEFLEELDQEEEGRDVTCYYMGSNGLQEIYAKARVASSADAMIPDLYRDIDIDQLIQFFTKSDSKILFLYGEPGTGKTTLLKYLISMPTFNKIAYCKDVKALEQNRFWLTIQECKYGLLLLDDLDSELSPREEGENPFVNNLLAFSDGILTNNTKIIITTNMKINSIDAALMRPGRCYDIIELNLLTYNEAQTLWTEVLKAKAEDFENMFNQEKNISQAALIEAYKLSIAKKTFRPYIKRGNQVYSIERKATDLGILVRKSSNYFGENK